MRADGRTRNASRSLPITGYDGRQVQTANPLAVMPQSDAALLATTDLEVVVAKPLTPPEVKELKRCEDDIELGQKEQEQGREKYEHVRKAIGDAFRRMAKAIHRIHKDKLYRGSQGTTTFEGYCGKRWKYSRAHGNRLAEIGQLLEAPSLSPRGDILNLLTSQGHFRPLLSLSDGDNDLQDGDSPKHESDSPVIKALNQVETWRGWQPRKPITPRMVSSAVVVTRPDSKKQSAPGKKPNKVVAKVLDYIKEARGDLPTLPKTTAVLDKLEAKVARLGRRRSTGIAWTEDTWNPLEGCSRASEGCEYCYAAKLIATRLEHKFPGLAMKTTTDDGTRYLFTNKILLRPELLGDPLSERTGKLYFVNSMSDLFHDKVPDEFIDAVFDVMERASWHVFQVLTKRTKRMADYTEQHYKVKPPPPNIWLGTSTEDQAAFNDRYPHLRRTKAAVRWLSCEPLIGELKLKLKDIHWVVVGGERGSERRMEKVWATAIRDECAKAKVPFFFKQWGAFDEEGKKIPQASGKAKHEATLDGVGHDAYPPQLKEVIPNY